jgi:hypothetical protein
MPLGGQGSLRLAGVEADLPGDRHEHGIVADITAFLPEGPVQPLVKGIRIATRGGSGGECMRPAGARVLRREMHRQARLGRPGQDARTKQAGEVLAVLVE